MYQRENEKIKLNHNRVKEDLKKRVWRGSFMRAVSYCMMTFVLTVLVLSVFLALSETWHPVIRIVGGILISAAGIALIVYLYIRIFGKYNNWAGTGRFHVVKGALSRAVLHGYQGVFWFVKKPFVPFDNAFYFGNYGAYYAEEDELARFDEGDEYYLVIFDDEPNRPAMIYRTDTYDWEE